MNHHTKIAIVVVAVLALIGLVVWLMVRNNQLNRAADNARFLGCVINGGSWIPTRDWGYTDSMCIHTGKQP